MDREAYNRLRWRCVRRGLLELDIVLEKFLAEDLDQLNDEELKAFTELADMDDLELWGMVSGAQPPSDARYVSILARLRKR